MLNLEIFDSNSFFIRDWIRFIKSNFCLKLLFLAKSRILYVSFRHINENIESVHRIINDIIEGIKPDFCITKGRHIL